MNQNTLINELNALQKHQENPEVRTANGYEVVSVQYSPDEHVIFIYTTEDMIDTVPEVLEDNLSHPEFSVEDVNVDLSGINLGHTDVKI